VSCRKTDEPVDTRSGMKTGVGPRDHVTLWIRVCVCGGSVVKSICGLQMTSVRVVQTTNADTSTDRVKRSVVSVCLSTCLLSQLFESSGHPVTFVDACTHIYARTHGWTERCVIFRFSHSFVFARVWVMTIARRELKFKVIGPRSKVSAKMCVRHDCLLWRPVSTDRRP